MSEAQADLVPTREKGMPRGLFRRDWERFRGLSAARPDAGLPPVRHGQRLLVLALATVLVVGLAVASMAVVAVAVLPVALVVVFAGLALVAGLGTRRGPAARRRARDPSAVPRTAGHVDAVVEPDADTAGRRWVTQWESGPPASALSFVRGRLAVLMAEWGLVDEAGEPTLLVVTELVSNAVDHARAPVRLVVEFLGGSVRVEVYDASSEPPRLQPHDPLRTRGRGLQMVEMLSTTWGWTDTSTGKVVWAEVLIEWPEESSSAAPDAG